MPSKKSDGDGAIHLYRLEDEIVVVPIIGLTPLIPHAWSEKSKRMMPGHPDAGTIDRMAKKGVRTPVEEAESCLYRLDDGRTAMQATAFKSAIVNACRLFKEPSMVEAKQLIFVEGTARGTDQLVPFSYEGEPTLREDTVRNQTGVADLRYRYAFSPWWSLLTIRYLPSSITRDSIFSLVDAAGRGGIGDWRPSAPKSSSGMFGRFRVMSDEEKQQYYG